MNRQVRVQWTHTARESFRRFPRKIRRAFFNKIDALLEVEDPRKVHKPLAGPLRGYYSIKSSRYRVLYTVAEEELANGKVLIKVTIVIVAAGMRKEGDKNDIYQFAKKLVQMGLVDLVDDDPESENE